MFDSSTSIFLHTSNRKTSQDKVNECCTAFKHPKHAHAGIMEKVWRAPVSVAKHRHAHLCTGSALNSKTWLQLTWLLLAAVWSALITCRSSGFQLSSAALYWTWSVADFKALRNSSANTFEHMRTTCISSKSCCCSCIRIFNYSFFSGFPEWRRWLHVLKACWKLMVSQTIINAGLLKADSPEALSGTDGELKKAMLRNMKEPIKAQ